MVCIPNRFIGFVSFHCVGEMEVMYSCNDDNTVESMNWNQFCWNGYWISLKKSNRKLTTGTPLIGLTICTMYLCKVQTEYLKDATLDRHELAHRQFVCQGHEHEHKPNINSTLLWYSVHLWFISFSCRFFNDKYLNSMTWVNISWDKIFSIKTNAISLYFVH